MFSHIDPKDIQLTDEEVLSSAFTMSQELIKPYAPLPVVCQEVGADNAIRVLSTAIALLESYEPEYTKGKAN